MSFVNKICSLIPIIARHQYEDIYDSVTTKILYGSRRSGHRGICGDVGCHIGDRGRHTSAGWIECQ